MLYCCTSVPLYCQQGEPGRRLCAPRARRSADGGAPAAAHGGRPRRGAQAAAAPPHGCTALPSYRFTTLLFSCADAPLYFELVAARKRRPHHPDRALLCCCAIALWYHCTVAQHRCTDVLLCHCTAAQHRCTDVATYCWQVFVVKGGVITRVTFVDRLLNLGSKRVGRWVWGGGEYTYGRLSQIS